MCITDKGVQTGRSTGLSDLDFIDPTVWIFDVTQFDIG